MSAIPPLVIPAVRIEDVVAIMDVMDDVNPIHVDEPLAHSLGLRGRVNQGPANLAYVINMLIAWAGSPEAIAHINVRFRAISCPDDRLEARGEVMAVEQTPDGPLARCSFELLRDGGEVILKGTADVRLPQAAADTLGAVDAG